MGLETTKKNLKDSQATAVASRGGLSSMAGTGQVRPYNMFKALVLIVGAAIASYASQLSLGPVYGDIPTSLYHEKICAGVFAGAWIGRILFGRVVPRPLALLTILAYYTPAIQRYAFRYSEEWGPYKGPVITEALTFYPQLFLAVLSSSVLLNSSNILFDAVPAGICFAVFRNVRAIIPGVMASHIGSNWLLTRCGLTHISAMVFNLFTSSAAVLATLVPAIAYSALLNPQCSNTAAVSYLNETIAASNYTLLSRRESITGYVSIMENTYHGYRMLRCDHSILGGEWQRAPPGFEHMETGIKEPIYSVFVMLEAVRLIEPGPVNKKPKALMIGLGVGTSANGMMKHGVETDLVELDPAVYDYAKEYFGLLPDHTAHIMDAVQYVNDAVVMEPRPVYDYIIHDVFTGGAVPASLFTVELLTGLKSLLAKDGAIAINYAGDLKLSPAKTIIETIRSVFEQCRVFREDYPEEENPDMDFTNMVIFCTRGPKPFTFRRPLEADFLQTFSRQKFLYPTYEINLEALLGGDADTDGTTEKGATGEAENKEGGSKWPLLDLAYAREFTELQKESAVGHWKIMRTVVPGKVWENY